MLDSTWRVHGETWLGRPIGHPSDLPAAICESPRAYAWRTTGQKGRFAARTAWSLKLVTQDCATRVSGQ
jgi:hypothetical protein